MSRRGKRRREPQTAGEGTAAGAGRGRQDAGRGRQDAGRGRQGAGRGRQGAGRGRQGAGRGRRDAERSPAGSSASAPTWSLGVQLAFLAAVFAVAVVVAELAGAANLGVALGVGQIAFGIAAIYLLVRR